MVATFGSTLLGFFREVVNAQYFGTQWQMDTFLAAATIPTILFGVFNGALVSALVPTFSDYLARGREDEAWTLASTIVNGLLVVLSAAALLGWIFAPYYVPLIAHGFPPPQLGVAVRMTRWLMPSIVATSLAGVVAAMLNAYHRFAAAAMQGVAINLVTMAAVVLLYGRYQIYALVLGTALGLGAQLLVQLPSFFAMRKYRLVVDLRHPGLGRMWRMLGPIVVGSAAGQVALFFDRFFASTFSPGYMAGMNYAVKLVGFPQQIFAAAIATVIFPLLASQFACRDRGGLRRSILMGLRLVNFITIPAVCGLVALAKPIVATLFERGMFRSTATDLTAGLLPFAAVGLVGLAANVVLTRACFACRETRWPVAFSVISVVANVALSLLWMPSLGVRGLLLANSVSQSAQALLLLALVWKLVRGLDSRALLDSTLRVGTASAAMVAGLHWIASLGAVPPATLEARVWFLAGQLLIAGAIFVGVAKLLNVEELGLTVTLVVERFRRHVPVPQDNANAPIA
jgi:putative peptidoglycan lipid II flippase